MTRIHVDDLPSFISAHAAAYGGCTTERMPPAQNARIVLRPRTASDRERQVLENTHHLRGSAVDQVEELLTRADARLPADTLAMVLDRVVRNAEIFGDIGHTAAQRLQRAAFGFSAHATRCMEVGGYRSSASSPDATDPSVPSAA